MFMSTLVSVTLASVAPILRVGVCVCVCGGGGGVEELL